MQITSYSTFDDTDALDYGKFIQGAICVDTNVVLQPMFKLNGEEMEEVFGGIPEFIPPTVHPEELFVLAISKNSLFVMWCIKDSGRQGRSFAECTYALGRVENASDIAQMIMIRVASQNNLNHGALKKRIREEWVRNDVDELTVATHRLMLLRDHGIDDETIERKRRELSASITDIYKKEIKRQIFEFETGSDSFQAFKKLMKGRK